MLPDEAGCRIDTSSALPKHGTAQSCTALDAQNRCYRATGSEQLLVILQVSNKGLVYLQGLQQLRRLGLQGTAVTSAGMPVIGSLSALQALDLAWTAVDSQGEI